MSRGIAAATSHRRYGAMDTVPDVDFAGSNIKAELEKNCQKVGTNIQTINNHTRELEREVCNIGTVRDTQNLRNNLQKTQLKCNELMPLTIEDLNTLHGKSRVADKEIKLQVERLFAEIELTIRAYTSVQKQIADKLRRHVLQEPVSPTEDPDHFQLREQEAAYNQQQKQVQMELEFESGMLEDRLASIKGVEAKVLDMNDLMRMLASKIHEQAPIIDTIEQNTENTLANVEAANQEVIKAASYVGRRRRTVFCLALVAIIVALIVLIILLNK